MHDCAAGVTRRSWLRRESMVKAAPLRERRGRCSRGRSTRPVGRPRRCGRSTGSSRCSRTELGLDPGPELAALEEAILRQDDACMVRGRDCRTSTSCPYQGLTPYDVDDAESFFGRDADVHRLPATCSTPQRVLTVVGPVGLRQVVAGAGRGRGGAWAGTAARWP